MYILYLYFTHTLVGMTYSYVFVCVCPVMSRHGILRKAVGAHLLPAQLGDSRLKQMRPSHQEPWCMKIGYTPPPCFSFLSFFHIMFPIKNQQFCGYPRIPHFQTDHYWVLLAVVVGNKHCSMLLFNVLQFVPETYFWTFLDM